MGYVLAVAAAMSNALTTVLQRLGVESAPADTSLRLSLITYAMRRKVWLVGFVVMTASFLLQASALHYGTLTEVQPILTLELPFLVALLGFWFKQPLSWREWVGAVAAAGGLATFLLMASPSPGAGSPSLRVWGMVAFAVILGAVVCVTLAQFGPPAWRAALFGASAAIVFAFTASLIKQVTDEASHQWSSIFADWYVYAMVVAGLTGLFLAQNAFHAGPVTASQAGLVIVDPLVSIAIGIGLFGDQVSTVGYHVTGEVMALVVLCLGGLLLARSPLVALAKSDDERVDLRRRSPAPEARTHQAI